MQFCWYISHKAFLCSFLKLFVWNISELTETLDRFLSLVAPFISMLPSILQLWDGTFCENCFQLLTIFAKISILELQNIRPDWNKVKHWYKCVRSLSANPTKWTNTLKQFVDFCRQIVWLCLTILWGWCLMS